MVKMFVLILEDDANTWFEICSAREIFLFASLTKAFCKCRSLSYEEKVEALLDEPHNSYVTIDAFHEKEKDIEELIFLFHSNPLKALMVEIKEKVEALNVLLVSPEEENYGSTMRISLMTSLLFHQMSHLYMRFWTRMRSVMKSLKTLLQHLETILMMKIPS